MATFWIVEKTLNARFPFRIRIEQDGRPLLTVRARSAWPGAGTQVFCLREQEFDPGETLEPHERVPVAHVARLGRKLSVTLDRPQRKRCEFLKVERPWKDRPGTHEEIFFRTEIGARAHRTSARVELVPQTALDVVVDVGERYPWRFPGARVVRRRLPAGDYAALAGERIVAVVERKSLENLLTEIHEIRGFHQQLAELGSYPHAAMLVEAQYADLGNPTKIGRWPTAHLLRVVGELAALHPTVPVVFAGNRKLANVWTQRFFAAVVAAGNEPQPDFAREPLARYEARPADGGLDTRIRVAAVDAAARSADGFALDAVAAECPEAPPARVRRILAGLVNEGRLRRGGRGRAARWFRADEGDPGARPG